MSIWNAKAGTIGIGIDIGWSERTKSCALAIRGCEPNPVPTSWTRYTPTVGSDSTHVGLFRLKELLQFLPEFLAQFKDRVSDMVVVVDGPLGPGGPPSENRHVDSAFCRGPFNGRMQPSLVTSKDGPKYVAVTRDVLDPFFKALGVAFISPWPFSGAKGQFVYAETHPTVGLALLVPQQAKKSLPSHKRPFKTPEKTFGAKSDWYWRIGARDRVAVALKARVSAETHHDRVAGLYCLAVAEALACHLTGPGPGVAAVGRKDGVYVIMSDVAAGWEAHVRDVGIRGGELRSQTAYPCSYPEVYPLRILTSSVANESSLVSDRVVHLAPVATSRASETAQDDDDPELKGDRRLLVLNDDGGIWQKHNEWLVGLEETTWVITLDSKQEVIPIKRATGGQISGQWVSVSADQTPLRLARARGYCGVHLKKSDSVGINVELLDRRDEPKRDAKRLH